MTKRRLTYIWLAANLVGMGTYLVLGYALFWVAPEDQGMPGGPGDAFVWFFTMVPVLLLFLIVNLVALYRVIKEYRQGKQLVPILLWVIVCSFWGNVLLFNQLKSIRFIDSQNTQTHHSIGPVAASRPRPVNLDIKPIQHTVACRQAGADVV